MTRQLLVSKRKVLIIISKHVNDITTVYKGGGETGKREGEGEGEGKYIIIIMFI